MLRGDYKQSEYGRVILPFTVLRRMDCVLAPTKKAVLAELALRKKAGVNPEPFLLKKAGLKFVNTSALDLRTLMGAARSWRSSGPTSICRSARSVLLNPSGKGT